MCVIMSAPTPSRDLKDQDPALLDKSVILATANVRTTSFSKEGVPAESRANPLGCKSPLWKHGSEVPLITDLGQPALLLNLMHTVMLLELRELTS